MSQTNSLWSASILRFLHMCEKFVVTFLPKRRNKRIILHAVISCNIYCERLKTYLIAVFAYSLIAS